MHERKTDITTSIISRKSELSDHQRMRLIWNNLIKYIRKNDQSNKFITWSVNSLSCKKSSFLIFLASCLHYASGASYKESLLSTFELWFSFEFNNDWSSTEFITKEDLNLMQTVTALCILVVIILIIVNAFVCFLISFLISNWVLSSTQSCQ